MIEECTEVLECINSIVCVSELETDRLAYVNGAGRDLLGIAGDADYLGRGFDEFFETCGPEGGDAATGSHDAGARSCRLVVKSTGARIDARAITFSQDGIDYRLVISDDSAELMRKKEAIGQIARNEAMLTEALSIAMGEEDPNRAIESLLRKLGEGFGADRAYVFEQNEKGNFDNTYEWCRAGVTSEIDNLQDVSEKLLVTWSEAFSRQGYLLIRDLEEYKDIDPDAYAVLKPQDIDSLIVFPITSAANRRAGFFGIDNPDISSLESSETILSVLGHFISSMIKHRTIVEKLRYVSERDDLTKAYNRTSAERLLSSVQDGTPYTMLLMDIDHIKDINEIYGTGFGDYVLKQFTAKLNEYLEGFPAFLARYGSDEFLVVLRGRKVGLDDPFVVNLRNAVHTPMEIGTASVTPTVCIGITYSDGDATMKQKVAEATRALHEAKKVGRATAMVFTEKMRHEMEEEVELKLRVRDAMRNDGFYMLYQPKVSVETLEVNGYEALVRMKGCDVSPAAFIPIALENGWLREIGRTTTEKTIAQLGRWQREGVDVKPVSINFSSVQVLDTGYFDFLMGTLERHGISPKLLQIEITEQVMMEFSERALRLLSRFHEAGIELLLDDFGTGYSSLSCINRLPLDTIKLDRSFVDGILVDERRYNMAKDIILLGHDQGMRIIAEGVETKEQFSCMKEMRADSIQGFFFSRPLAPQDAVEFAASHRARERLL